VSDRFHRNKAQFAATFDVALAEFWDPAGGFDVVGFDKWLKVPDGKSTSEVIIERYGDVAEGFVRGLL
jgi:hypothetical protein